MVKDDSFFGKSKCRGGWLHRFNIQRQWEDCVEEVCEICGKSVFFKVINGHADNSQYISYHARQCLPKQHPLFSHEYKK